MLKKTAIAGIAVLTIAVASASPAQALSKKQKIGLGLGLAFGTAAAIAGAHAHGGYYGDHGHGYRGGRHYRRSARRCARRFGWHTFRWERCMYRRGY